MREQKRCSACGTPMASGSVHWVRLTGGALLCGRCYAQGPPEPEPVVEPRCVSYAVARYKQEGERGISWTWFHGTSDADRKAFERFLVRDGHPLAYEAGTAEWRFREYVRQRAAREDRT